MHDTSDLSSRRWLILASTVVSFFAVGTTFFAVPPLVEQLTESFSLSHLQIGVLMGAIAIPAVVISIPLGAAVDRWPARAAGVVGLVLMAGGATLFALAPSFPMLVAGRVLFGVGGLIMNLLLARLVTAAFAGRELSLAMGIFNSVYPASMIVMFSLHPAMLAAFGWQGELLVLAGLAVAALPLHVVAVPAGLRGSSDSGSHHRSSDRRRVTPSLLALGSAWGLFFGVYAAVFTFAPEWAGGGATALVTVSLIAWTALVLAPLVGAAIDRLGRPERWLAGSLGLLGAVLAAMAADLVPPAPAMIAIGAAVAAALTSTYSLPGRLVAATNVGFAFGFITALSNLTTLVGPATAGAIFDRAQLWAVPWTVLSAIAVTGAVVALLIRPGSRDGGPGG